MNDALKKYDVIVVGAGNGGLASAALCAKAGLKTLLLEKHNLPGGCATSFVRGRFEFEAALHELCHSSTSENADSVTKIFERLGADMDLHSEDTLFRVINRGEDPYDLTLHAGVDNFLNDMEAAVPGCRESVKELFDLMAVLDEAQEYMNGPSMNPSVLFNKYGDFMRVAAHSFDEVMDAVGVPEKAQRILETYWAYLGVPTDDMNALHYLSMVLSYIGAYPTMPGHRSHYLSLSLVKALQDHGGEVRFNTEVTRFLYDGDGAAIGVVANGDVIYSKKIISNIIPNNVINRSDPEKIPSHAKKLASARKLGMTFVSVYLGLDASMEELGIKDYSVFIMNGSDPREQFNTRKDGSIYVVNCLNKVLPESSPKGTCTLFFTIPVMPGDFPETVGARDYKKYKNAVAERYIKDYEKVLGVSVMPHIEEIVVATPVTFARYLATPAGAIYGYANEEWDNVVTRAMLEAVDYSIPNLHFCGGSYIRGDGYPSAYLTGAMAADKVISELKEEK
ncbi:MAG: NAD(P)/FAD-dependent oxidoreductase [Clostridia bacterium]|nr:NAD(P)/FAD-dependent oxidoreductase [Clostridia bacterium]